MTRNHRLLPAAGPALAAIALTAIGSLWAAAGRAELEITGINGASARNIRLFTPLSDEPCDAEQWRIRRRFRTLVRDAEEALEPFGYYDPVIKASLRFEESCWVADLDVDPGPPVRLRNVDIRLDGDEELFASLLDDDALRRGRILRHAEYEGLKRRLQVTAAEHGFVDAEFRSSRIDVWPEELAADIDIDFKTGERYVLGEIDVRQDFLKPELVNGYIDLQPGTPFDREEISRAHTDLNDSGYFGRIQVTPDFSAASDGKIPLDVILDPGTRIEYTVGAGYSTDTGPRFRAGFRNNRLNAAGHRIKADLNVSEVLQGLSGEYRRPLADPRSEWMTYTGSLSQEQTDTFENDKATVGVRRTRRMSETWIRTLGLDFSYDSFIVAEESEDTFLMIPSITFDHKRADRNLYPDRGRRFTVEFLGTSDSIGSSTSFTQVTAWARWVRSLGDNMRVIARGTVGRIETDDFEGLPPDIRYFAGGDQSVRGFDFESLGPTNEDGEVIGGTNLLVASVELERRIKGNFFGAVFVDAGNAYNDEEFDPAIGVGVGVSWRSPVGPLRLYVGFPVDEDDRNPRLHIRLGAEL